MRKKIVNTLAIIIFVIPGLLYIYYLATANYRFNSICTEIQTKASNMQQAFDIAQKSGFIVDNSNFKKITLSEIVTIGRYTCTVTEKEDGSIAAETSFLD